MPRCAKANVYQHARAARPKPEPYNPEIADLPVAAFAVLIARPISSVYHAVRKNVVPTIMVNVVGWRRLKEELRQQNRPHSQDI